MPDQTNQREGADKPEASGLQADARLDKLTEAIGRARGKSAPAKSQDASSVRGYGQAMRLSSEFIAGILVGAALGWAVDQLLGISPWGLIVFLILGFAAGVLNLLRAAKMVDDPAVRLDKKPPQG